MVGTFQSETISDEYHPTIVSDFHVYKFKDIDPSSELKVLEDVSLNIWDLGGHVEFAHKRKELYKDS